MAANFQKSLVTHRIPILPLCPFGNVFFCYHLLREKVILDLGENYPKQTWRNRYDVPGPNGMLNLTIPVIGTKGNKIPSGEICIDNRQSWADQHRKTLRAAFGSSPFFEHYAPAVEDVLSQQYELLADFNLATLKLIQQWLSLSVESQISKTWIEPTPGHLDMRPYFKPVHFKALHFETNDYIQVFADRFTFAPNCSILDVIFNLGPEAVNYLQQCRFEESQITILDR